MEAVAVEVQQFGHCRVETVMRRKYMEITRDFEREPKKRKETLVLSGAEVDTEGLSEDGMELFRYKDDGTVEVHRWISDAQWNCFHGLAKRCAKTVNWRRKRFQLGRERPLEDFGRKCGEMTKQATRTRRASCGKAQIFLRHLVSEIQGR